LRDGILDIFGLSHRDDPTRFGLSFAFFWRVSGSSQAQETLRQFKQRGFIGLTGVLLEVEQLSLQLNQAYQHVIADRHGGSLSEQQIRVVEKDLLPKRERVTALLMEFLNLKFHQLELKKDAALSATEQFKTWMLGSGLLSFLLAICVGGDSMRRLIGLHSELSVTTAHLRQNEAALAEAGQLKLEPKAVWLETQLAEAVSFHQCSAQKKGIQLSLKQKGTPSVVSQVLPDPHLACIVVSDTGPGLSPDAQNHIFDRFWRGTESSPLGAGLGLAVARGLVEAHGGKIWVESQPGQGSSFCFTLPKDPELQVQFDSRA